MSQSPKATDSETTRADDTSLFNLIAHLLRISPIETEEFDSYTQAQCETEIDSLAEYLCHPEGRGVKHIQQVVLRLFVLHHQKAQLQIATLKNEVSMLRARLPLTNGMQYECVQSLSSAGTDRPETPLEKTLREGREVRARARRVLDHATPRHSGAESSDYSLRTDYPASRATADTLRPHLHLLSHYPPATCAQRTGMLLSGDETTPQLPPPRRLTRTPSSPPKGKGRTPRHGDAGVHRSFLLNRSDRSQHSSTATTSDSSEDDRRPRPRPQSKRDQDTGLRMRQLDALAADIERFDPETRDANVHDYLREIEYCLNDLPHASSREKLRLIWKTTSRSVRGFIEMQPSQVRRSYSRLCNVLREEYTPYADEASATLSAIQIKQRRIEAPREYYRRLRNAYFQGSTAPGLEEDRAFKSLFLHNLHPCVRTHVTLMCNQGKCTMQEMKRMAQITWETVVRPTDQSDRDVEVFAIQSSDATDLELEGDDRPPSRVSNRAVPHSPHQQGEWCNQWSSRSSTPQDQRRPKKSNSYFGQEPSQWNRDRQNLQELSDDELGSEISFILKRLTKHIDDSGLPYRQSDTSPENTDSGHLSA